MIRRIFSCALLFTIIINFVFIIEPFILKVVLVHFFFNEILHNLCIIKVLIKIKTFKINSPIIPLVIDHFLSSLRTC